MIMVSPMGVEVDASEEHAEILRKDGWAPAKAKKPAKGRQKPEPEAEQKPEPEAEQHEE